MTEAQAVTVTIVYVEVCESQFSSPSASARRRSRSRRTRSRTGAPAAVKAIALERGSPAPQSDRIRFGMIGIGLQPSGLLGAAIGLPGVECVAAADLYDGRHTLAKEITGNATPTRPFTPFSLLKMPS